MGIKAFVPYECVVSGVDLASGKTIRNIYYYRSGIDTDVTYTYGEDIAATSLGTFATNLETMLTNAYPFVFTLQGEWDNLLIKSIVGSHYATLSHSIVTVASSGGITLFITGTPHGFTSGQTVNVYGITSVPTLNGIWVVTVLSASSFSIAYDSSAYTWGGDGLVQAAAGRRQFLYGEQYEKTIVVGGGVDEESLALFATASVRRLNVGVGRHFRSRLSMSPIPETHFENGTIVAAGTTAWNSFNTVAIAPVLSGAGGGSHWRDMLPWVVSKSLALSQPTPFTQSETWSRAVTSFSVRPNNGSLLRRKPKLTAAISVGP